MADDLGRDASVAERYAQRASADLLADLAEEYEDERLQELVRRLRDTREIVAGLRCVVCGAGENDGRGHLSIDPMCWTCVCKPDGGETIETAAIRINGEVWTLPRPARHDTVLKAWAWAHRVEDSEIGWHEQGFVTSMRRFVDRAEAAAIAFEANQIEREENDCLASEDLW